MLPVTLSLRLPSLYLFHTFYGRIVCQIRTFIRNFVAYILCVIIYCDILLFGDLGLM